MWKDLFIVSLFFKRLVFTQLDIWVVGAKLASWSCRKFTAPLQPNLALVTHRTQVEWLNTPIRPVVTLASEDPASRVTLYCTRLLSACTSSPIVNIRCYCNYQILKLSILFYCWKHFCGLPRTSVDKLPNAYTIARSPTRTVNSWIRTVVCFVCYTNNFYNFIFFLANWPHL